VTVGEAGPAERERPVGTQLGGIPETEWRRLDARMLLVHPVQAVVRSLPALLAIFLARSATDPTDRWELIAVPFVMALGVLRWFTTRYRIGNGQLSLRYGLLNRTTTTAPLDRVRTVDLTAQLHHRALGLARIEISTGSHASDQIVLDSLSLAEGRRLREDLLHRAAATSLDDELQPATPALDEELLRLDPRWIRFAPFTLTGLATAAALFGFLTQGWQAFADDSAVLRAGADQVRALGWGVAVAVAVVAIAALAAVAYVLAFWGFRLTRSPRGSLHAARGLLTTRETSIDHERLRGVELEEPLGLRLAGARRLKAVTTGLTHPGQGGSDWLAPPAPSELVVAVGAEVVGDAPALRAALVPHGAAARTRRRSRALLPAVLASVALLVGEQRWGLPASMVAAIPLLLVGALALARDRYRGLGHLLTARHLVARSGSIARSRAVLDRSGIIGWTVRQSFFQRRAGIVTLVATTAAGKQHYDIIDVTPETAYGLIESVSPEVLAEFV
jgi:putative membrane protein